MYPKTTVHDMIKKLKIEALLEMKEAGYKLKKEEAEYLAKNHFVQKAKDKLLLSHKTQKRECKKAKLRRGRK